MDLKEKIDYLNSLEKQLVENEFSKLWCGCLVYLLRGDWNEIYCSGEIDNYEFSGTTLCITVTNAWSELGEWRQFIKSRFPNIYISNSAEESGNLYSVTNDKEGDYFPERYNLNYLDNLEYFNSFESAGEYVKGLTGKDVQTENDITSAPEELEEKNLEENENAFYNFNLFTVLSEDELR